MDQREKNSLRVYVFRFALTAAREPLSAGAHDLRRAAPRYQPADDVLLPTEALRAWLVFLDRGWKRSFSGVPLPTDIARLDRHVAKVQEAEVTSSRLSHWHGYP